MRRRCRLTPTSLDRWPAHRGPQHHTLKAGDRADPQFARSFSSMATSSCESDTPPPSPSPPTSSPSTRPLQAPPPDPDDFICAQWGLASADGRNEPLAWVCDITFERYPETAHQLAGRIDQVVARRMHSVDLLLVLDVPTASNWNTDDVRLIVPNDKGLWSPWP